MDSLEKRGRRTAQCFPISMQGPADQMWEHGAAREVDKKGLLQRAGSEGFATPHSLQSCDFTITIQTWHMQKSKFPWQQLLLPQFMPCILIIHI